MRNHYVVHIRVEEVKFSNPVRSGESPVREVTEVTNLVQKSETLEHAKKVVVGTLNLLDTEVE